MPQQETLAVRVARRERLATDILGLILAPIDDAPLPSASAGAHIDVGLPNGQVRQYSIVSHTAAGYELAVLREAEGRGGSRCVHDDLMSGDRLEISAPRNLFPLAGTGGCSLLFAGGIGITPILAMAEALSASGAPFELHYCFRSRERAAFLDRLAQTPYAAQVHLHPDDAPENRLNLPAILAAAGDDAHLYVCGPGGFMDYVLATAAGAGWPEARLHSERFQAAPVATADDGSFELVIASTGQRIVVGPEQTAIAALHAAGVQVPMSCEQGICGTCLTRVLEGEPDHRDMFLTAAEHHAGDRFTPCCSRARGPRLVLDL